MRLTLRTLLAYRDGVLSSTETSNLHQRIKQTEVARNLLRRIEGLVQRKQLLAPKVSGTGIGEDANTVAEYLDDILASEQVPEFERICIAESDVALAELAHCHQLLAEALHSQVAVPPSLRALAISLTNAENREALSRRLKNPVASRSLLATAVPPGSIRRVDGSHATPLATATEANSAANSAEDGSSTLVKQGAESSGSESPMQKSQVQAPMVTSGGGSIKPQGLDLERPQLAQEVPEYLLGQRGAGWRVPLAIGAMLALLGVLVWQALGPLQSVQELFVANSAKDDSASHVNGKDRSRESSVAAREPDFTNSVKAADAAADTAGDATAMPKMEANDTEAQAVDEGASVAGLGAAKQSIEPNNGSELPQTSGTPSLSQTRDSSFLWTPADPDDLKSVLLVRNASATGEVVLSRLEPATAIPADAEIIVPPAMRPTLDLAGRCLWTVCGPTLIKPSINAASGDVVVSTSLCRGLTKAGPHGGELTVAAFGCSVKIQFTDATSMASIEVAHRPVKHGPLTDKLAFKPLLIVIAVEGQVVVTAIRDGREAKSSRLSVGEGVAFEECQPRVFELSEIPAWYRATNERPLDVLAASDMHKLLSSSDTASKLTLMSVHHRPETAALGVQTSILLGQWNVFATNFLSNELMRSHWTNALLLAEQMILSDPRSAELLHQELEAAHPGRGDRLFNLLVGSVEGKLGQELLTKFVETLGSAQLDERVLALYQLRRLTGKDLGFQPSFPNRAAQQSWRREIASNRLVLLPLDDSLWEAKKPANER